jgi:hypothetical protein
MEKSATRCGEVGYSVGEGESVAHYSDLEHRRPSPRRYRSAMPASRITLPVRETSSRIIEANSSRVLPIASTPMLSMRSRMAGCCSTWTISWLSRSRLGGFGGREDAGNRNRLEPGQSRFLHRGLQLPKKSSRVG